MSDKKLTQEQINELFGIHETGGENAVEEMLKEDNVNQGYQPYDWDRPDKFNLENIRGLESISNVFARNFSQHFSATLRGFPIRFEYNSIEQIPYNSEYIEKMPKNFYVFCITDLGHSGLGQIILEFDISMVISIHRKLMGGWGTGIEDNRRPLTEIERLAMEEWVEEYLFPQLEDAFSNVIDLSLRISNIEDDAQYAKITTSTDMIALITFDVYIGNQSTTMRLCLPYLSIDSIIDKLTTENLREFRLEKHAQNEEDEIREHLKLEKQQIDIELGKTDIPIKDLLSLEKGDVLPLDKDVTESLIGYISNIPKFSCSMGKKGKKIAVKIDGLVEKGGKGDE